MTDVLLTSTDEEEALSRVYVQAVAVRAGYVTGTCELDRDGVDLRIHAGGDMRPTLDLQLKATVNLKKATDGFFHFPLKQRNYDLLRIDTQTPRLLVVLDLPAERGDWMTITEEELVLRRCAFWLSLAGYEEKPNRSSVTVHIPPENRFDIEGLRALMEQSRGGKIT